MPDDLIRTVDPATGLTSCCGAMSTYSDETECCKACWNEVVGLDGGTVVTLTEPSGGDLG